MEATIYKGVIKGNVIILRNNAVLPKGTEVEIRPLIHEPDLSKRKESVKRIKEFGEKLKGRNINLSKYVIEARQ